MNILDTRERFSQVGESLRRRKRDIHDWEQDLIDMHEHFKIRMFDHMGMEEYVRH